MIHNDIGVTLLQTQNQIFAAVDVAEQAPASRESMLVLVILGVLLLIGFVVWLAGFVTGFSRELRYINMEIDRSEGRERRHWEKKRRRLWLSLIPFVRY